MQLPNRFPYGVLRGHLLYDVLQYLLKTLVLRTSLPSKVDIEQADKYISPTSRCREELNLVKLVPTAEKENKVLEYKALLFV